jgi:rubrerythrin
MKMYRCRICGETHLGTVAPTRCPFCGAHDTHIVEGDGFDSAENAVQLTEIERADIERAIEIERSNARFYSAMVGLEGDENLSSAYKRLSRIEAEHCSVFSKLIGSAKPGDLDVPEGETGQWCDAIEESASRERTAARFYAEVAARATNRRVIEVFDALSAIEADHLEFDELAARRAECR